MGASHWKGRGRCWSLRKGRDLDNEVNGTSADEEGCNILAFKSLDHMAAFVAVRYCSNCCSDRHFAALISFNGLRALLATK